MKLAMLEPDQILLSGLRPIAELKRDLDWVSQKIFRSHSQQQERV